jgi:hypothetical protein
MHLHTLPVPQKVLLTSFLILVSLGYATGLVFVEFQTSLRSEGVQRQFLGSPEGGGEDELAFEKSPREMLVFLHNHLLGLSLIFLAVGGIFSLAAHIPPTVKAVLIAEPFAAVLTTFGGIALMRFISPGWSWLVVISGSSMGLAYVTMVALSLREMWRRGGIVESPPGKRYHGSGANKGTDHDGNLAGH